MAEFHTEVGTLHEHIVDNNTLEVTDADHP